MKIVRTKASDEQLLDATAGLWDSQEARSVPLVPTPLNGNPAIKRVSSFLEKSTDHGVISELNVRGMHNDETLALHLTWRSDKHDRIVDLDEFVDGAAVMFPLTPNASAVLMGSPTDPVNAWYWKGNLIEQGFDVIAQGYGTSARSKSAHQPIQVHAVHSDGFWRLSLARKLSTDDGRINFEPGTSTRIAFALWDGGNRERAGRKSFSGDFTKAEIEA